MLTGSSLSISTCVLTAEGIILFQLMLQGALHSQNTMADVKANAEALVPKFKLDRLLNQGV